MLSNKFALLVVVAIVLIIGFGIFPAFNSFFSNINTVGLDTQMSGISKAMPYIFFGVIFYAGYIIWKKGRQ